MSGDDEDKDFAVYEEREQKIEKLIAKNYQSKIRSNPAFEEHLENLKRDLKDEKVDKYQNLPKKDQIQALIVKTNEYLKHIDNDILIVHKSLRDAYESKFLELESIVLSPIEYAKTVKEIGNLQDITKIVDNLAWLSNQTIMSVTVAFSASNGQQLSDKQYGEVMQHADEILKLNDQKNEMLNYLESRMSTVAPNVSAIVGTRVAAKIIAAAGGIMEL